MKHKNEWLSALLALTLMISMAFMAVAYAVGPEDLDVEKRALTIDGHTYTLAADAEKPLRFVQDDMEIIGYALTTEGEIEFTLGSDSAALEFVAIAVMAGIADVNVTALGREAEEAARLETAAAPAEASAATAAACPECGKSLASGDHSKLSCGHYRCVVGDSHPTLCSHCKRYTCNMLDHNTKCNVCGKYTCTKAHRENCGTAKANANNANKGKGYQGGAVASDGSSFSPYYYYPYYYYGGGPVSSQLQELKIRQMKLLNAIEKLERGWDEDYKGPYLEELYAELKEVEAKIDALR